ncbi:MAG TPA: BatA domain-containing protein, partial [Chryseosolibacter sp.]
MISFVNPSWLLGLVGLLIPIGIHLLSRKEGKTIHVGSIRHLYDSDTAQFSSIRLNEILLLLLRLLLITLLVFILAGLKFAQDDYVGKKWLLIEMGVQRDERYKPTLDTLSAQNYEVRWLTEGFPQLADSAGIHGVENYAPLVQKIPRNLDSVVVMTYAFAARVKGERISIPKHVLWFPVEPPGSTIAVDAVRLPQDSVVIRLMASKPTGTTLEYSKLSTHLFDRITKADSLSLRNPDTVTISVYWTQDFSYDRKIIQAAIQTIS